MTPVSCHGMHWAPFGEPFCLPRATYVLNHACYLCLEPVPRKRFPFLIFGWEVAAREATKFFISRELRFIASASLWEGGKCPKSSAQGPKSKVQGARSEVQGPRDEVESRSRFPFWIFEGSGSGGLL